IVIPVVVGSSPISHPKEFRNGIARNRNAVFVLASVTCDALSFKELNARASGQPQIHPFRNGFSNSFKPL
ncbi:MAG: hypothetical protein ACN6QC_32980, partial [Paraburkholderia hospita]